tara:strand:+ start:40 stop:237 length:198 start_codon:yes stop_codon:yes gene_type:complete
MRKYCSNCEKSVVLKNGECPKCENFLWDPSDTPEKFTYSKRSGEDYYKLMIEEKILPDGFMGVKG